MELFLARYVEVLDVEVANFLCKNNFAKPCKSTIFILWSVVFGIVLILTSRNPCKDGKFGRTTTFGETTTIISLLLEYNNLK